MKKKDKPQYFTETITKQSNLLDSFLVMKNHCVNFHQNFANKIGLEDTVISQYNIDKASKKIDKENHHSFVIYRMNNNEKQIIGAYQFSEQQSDIDNQPIIFVDFIYIREKYRNQKFATSILDDIIKSFPNKRVELECWYNLPANQLYKDLKFKEIRTRYAYNIQNDKGKK